MCSGVRAASRRAVARRRVTKTMRKGGRTWAPGQKRQNARGHCPGPKYQIGEKAISCQFPIIARGICTQDSQVPVAHRIVLGSISPSSACPPTSPCCLRCPRTSCWCVRNDRSQRPPAVERIREGGALDEVGLVGARCVERGGGASLGLLAATHHGVGGAEECPEGEHGELKEES